MHVRDKRTPEQREWAALADPAPRRRGPDKGPRKPYAKRTRPRQSPYTRSEAAWAERLAR